MNLRFSRPEIRDLAVAWVTLGVAFTVLYQRQAIRRALDGDVTGVSGTLGSMLALSMVTVGIGFLLHELAHKVVAVQFGQIAEFRADYSMLFVALVGSFAGFLFAAPGAVHHRGPVSPREHGLIALAGPITNLVLASVFFVLLFLSSGFLSRVAGFGLAINLLLAGFNMIPFGPLDGRTVLDWSTVVYVVVALPSIGLGALALVVLL